MAAESGRRRRRLSLRWRIVLVATAVVAVALVVGSAAFVGVLRDSLVAGVQLTAERDAAELVGQVETAGAASVDTDVDDDDDQIVQLVSADGALLASSDNADDGALLVLPALQHSALPVPADDQNEVSPTPTNSDDDPDSDDADDSSGRGSNDDSDDDSSDSSDSSSADDSTPSPAPPATTTRQPTTTPVLIDDSATHTVTTSDGDSFVLVARTAAEANSARELWVVAARSLATVDGTISTVLGLLAVALPLLLIVLGFTISLVVGRALRPVDRMRQQVDAVTASSLDKRIADPGTDDEVGRLAHTMNRMLQRLDDSRRSQNRFISDASHELKSPLASLRQYAEVARAHPDRISPDELSAAVLDEGARLEGLVQGMLVLAKADERMLTRPATLVDLDDIVFAEARRLRDSTALTIGSSAVSAAQLRGDAGLLAQLVRNLVDNAARHATSRVALAVRSSDVDGTVTLVVEDDGGGVPEADRQRVFERFVRLDEARARDGGGSGLGLAIVREIAAAHGGTVVVEAAAGGGARFVVTMSAR